MTIPERLERLERENRWMRRIGAVGIALASTAILAGQGKPAKLADLEVQSLTVRGADGSARIRLSVEDGAARVSLFTADGKPGCELSVGDTHSGLGILNHGKPMVDVFQRNDGPPPDPRMPSVRPWGGLISYDCNGAKRVALTGGSDGATLTLYGARGGSHGAAGARIDVEDSQVEMIAWSGGDAAFDKESRRFRVVVPGGQVAPSAEIANEGTPIWKVPAESAGAPIASRQKAEAAQGGCKRIYDVVQVWCVLTKAGGPPDTLAELEKPISKASDAPYWSAEVDPWGGPYRIEKIGGKQFRIWSNGPDGQEATDDDICYPPRDGEAR